jgi:hypothetical protein
VSEKLEKLEMGELLKSKPFLNFLFRVIQTAGIHGATTDGPDGRNLIREGRRNLGLEILHDVARGQPVADPDAAFSMTLIQVLREALQAAPQENPRNGRHDRYADTGSDGDGGS